VLTTLGEEKEISDNRKATTGLPTTKETTAIIIARQVQQKNNTDARSAAARPARRYEAKQRVFF